MSYLYNIIPDTFEERLETPNLLLRPYEEGDEGDLMRLVQENPDALNPAFSSRLARVRELEGARMQVQQLRTAWDNRKAFDFGVWLKENNKYIGDIALKNFDYKIPKAEVGLYFTEWPETKSYVEEALRLMIRFSFETLRLNKIYIRCTENNTYYGELAESCGFQKEGLLRSDYKGVDSDELFDLSYYGMTKKDYEKQQQAEQKSSEEMA